ncbi:putative ABC transporter, permease component [Blattabacterium sp. (Periplaneta americana) str. BPLAN]|uniref:ABC transporter permease n=1 Tax=Blattabacterium sp. (Periplaneta americana) TaxID=367488 RepID=UPI0001BA0CB8|nr:FtsX-like permease family protein [Blattabacterium sp. (Periplaneta americana)]ACX84083.1 putative ABC transporter, permease component [Blattabacterium sp. (Periplaneta americana) str. BPLAN]
MNFEWFFSRKTIWKDCRKKKILRTIVLVTQSTIVFSVIISILTFSVGFGFKKVINQKFLNIQGPIIVVNNPKKETCFLSLEKKNLFLFNSVSFVYPFSEKEVIVCKSEGKKDVDRFVFKGISKDYNPVFFKNFLVSGSKKNLFSRSEILLSKKISNLLKLNKGSSILIGFISIKNGKPFVFYKQFYVCGLYDTGIPEFDNVYLIGDMKHIQSINGWKENFVEGFEIFISSLDSKRMESIKKEIDRKYSDKFLVKTIYNQYNQDIIEWLNVFNVNIFVIIFVVITAIIFNIIVFSLILLLERMKTIGILKTLGTRNQIIHKIFLYYIMHILIPPLIIGNSIGFLFLILQKKFRLISLNQTQYYVDVVPVYLNINHFLCVNISIILVCFFSVFFPFLFIISKIPPIKVIKFE